MNLIYQEDQITLKPERITDGTHPIYGDTTIFHDIPIASEMVQQYDDGYALKDREELQAYTNTMEFSCAVVVGGHPQQGIVSDIDQISGRTTNHRFVKNLNDPKTNRPNRAGIRADIEIFNKKVSPQLLDDMKSGKKPDVSIGFFFTPDVTPGEFNGEAYDYIQRNMLHNHLAAGIDNGRCPSPYCGLGADEIRKQIVGDPFAGFEDFDACMAEMTKPKSEGGQGYSEETARKVCGKLQAEHEKDKEEDEYLDKSSRVLRALLENEIEAIRGEREALRDQREWWMILDWTDPQLAEAFDHLTDDIKNQITEAGLCPTCGDKDEEEPPTDTCVCPECGATAKLPEGKHCPDVTCPECGAAMRARKPGTGGGKGEGGPSEDENPPYEDGEALEFKLVPVDEKPPEETKKQTDTLDPYEVLRKSQEVLMRG